MKRIRVHYILIVSLLLTACMGSGSTEDVRTVFNDYFDRHDTNLVWLTADGISADADSLLAVLRREVPACGLDTADSQLETDIAVCFPTAYIGYTTGMRYGFMRPERVFNRLDYKRKKGKVTEEFARLFDYEIIAHEKDEARGHLTAADRMDYLLQSEPNSPVYRKLKSRMATASDTTERLRLAVNLERCRWPIKAHLLWSYHQQDAAPVQRDQLHAGQS